MRISDIQQAPLDRAQRSDSARQVAQTGAMEFKRQLTSLSNEDYKSHIERLIGRIDEQGKLLGKRADIREFQKYREMITELLGETVSNSYAFNKSGCFDARGRHRVYAVVRKVNASLDDLAGEILKEQSDNLRVLGKIDDIRGLILDLYL